MLCCIQRGSRPKLYVKKELSDVSMFKGSVPINKNILLYTIIIDNKQLFYRTMNVYTLSRNRPVYVVHSNHEKIDGK